MSKITTGRPKSQTQEQETRAGAREKQTEGVAPVVERDGKGEGKIGGPG